MHFDWYRMDALTPEFMAHWRALGLCASSPNVYLMPEFMLPAVRHLDTDKAPRLAALWNADRSILLALGVFNAVTPSWRFPYPRLSAVLTKYSLQSGVLLRAGIDVEAVDQFIGGLFSGPWRAVRITELREDSLVYRQIQEAALRRGLRWFVDMKYERAAVKLGEGAHWHEHISHSRHRRLRNAHSRLAKLGSVEFRVVQGAEVSESNAEALLRVEAMGWKRASALLAAPARAHFFREMVRACSGRNFVFFCELLLDGNVIASTSNFNVNGYGFAFKVGNDPTYAKFSPGYLVEYLFLQSCTQTCPDLHEVESGSMPGSYIEVLWPERIPIVSGHLVDGKLPAAYATFKQHIKGARRSFGRG